MKNKAEENYDKRNYIDILAELTGKERASLCKKYGRLSSYDLTGICIVSARFLLRENVRLEKQLMGLKRDLREYKQLSLAFVVRTDDGSVRRHVIPAPKAAIIEKEKANEN